MESSDEWKFYYAVRPTGLHIFGEGGKELAVIHPVQFIHLAHDILEYLRWPR